MKKGEAESERQENPFYCKPLTARYNRRAYHHDYTRPARYMITLKKAPYIPVFSLVCGNPASSNGTDAPSVLPSEPGLAFLKATELWSEQYPQIKIDELVVMPDHVHFCINVVDRLPNGLSRAMAGLMGKVSSLYYKLRIFDKHPDELSRPVFQKGYTDSIAYSEEQYEVQKQYVRDNPRRLLIKRLHPDLFFKRWILSVNGLQLMAIGNIFLLKNPHLQVVRFSRRFSKEELDANDRSWRICLENGGVLISPFIHPVENEMRKFALANEGCVIRICENGFSERFSPNKMEFEPLGAGRLLLIAPLEFNSQKREMKYNYAQYLNSLAVMLASHPEGLRMRPHK